MATELSLGEKIFGLSKQERTVKRYNRIAKDVNKGIRRWEKEHGKPKYSGVKKSVYARLNREAEKKHGWSKEHEKRIQAAASSGKYAPSFKESFGHAVLEIGEKRRKGERYGFVPPPAGDRSQKVKDILARVYSNERKKGRSKEQSAKIAWGAVKRSS